MFLTLDEMVSDSGMAHVIDRFVEVCNLKDMGFTHTELQQTGRPPYDPKAMAKLLFMPMNLG